MNPDEFVKQVKLVCRIYLNLHPICPFQHLTHQHTPAHDAFFILENVIKHKILEPDCLFDILWKLPDSGFKNSLLPILAEYKNVDPDTLEYERVIQKYQATLFKSPYWIDLERIRIKSLKIHIRCALLEEQKIISLNKLTQIN